MNTITAVKTEVFINGNFVPGLIQATINSTNHFAADSFSLTYSIGGYGYSNAAFWLALNNAYVAYSDGCQPGIPTQSSR